MTDWYQLEPQAALKQLESNSATGLAAAEAERRLSQHGPNKLTESKGRSSWLILWDQLKELMVVLLIVAAAISALLQDYKDAAAITAIVVLNALLGFSQEYRAEKAMAALKKLTSPTVKARRSGEIREMPAAELVPGDIVLLEAGNLVAADCRVLESASLQTQESALTGESQPVRKTTAALEGAGAALGDRHNMAYMGTFISAGRGQAVVVETGMRTELGRIAGMIHHVGHESTPLQRRLSHLGKRLAATALFLVTVIFILGLVRGEDLKVLFLTAVSIGVAAVPEGLPAVVTIALTLGAHRMLRRKALIRRLSAVETLGSVTVICSDKTGTLTENRMAAATLEVANHAIELSAADTAKRTLSDEEFQRSGFGFLLAGAALCNDATTQTVSGESGPPLGDPTETALVTVALEFGLHKAELERVLPRVSEIPFTSARKRMTTVHAVVREGSLLVEQFRTLMPPGCGAHIAFTKGSVEGLLEISDKVWVNGTTEMLDGRWRERLMAANDHMASKGMRILGVAYRCLEVPPADGEQELIERNLTFAGMIGLIDPARKEAAEAVDTCKSAGVRPVMITGDHPLTAQYIATQLGISNGQDKVLLGTQLDQLAAQELEKAAESTQVYARVSPEHKLKIIESLQRQGHIVAMTGDGVNDAPALKKADIGLAMGITGTDVAKEAADMVLLDDNFSTIVAAVEEGRVIYDNIRKFVKYILTTNSGEIWLMLGSPVLGMPLPLLPLQILWINLMTDGLPALALGVEPAEADTMRRPPHPPAESIFARGLGRHVVWVGLLMGLLSAGVGYWYWRAGDPKWQTMVFTTITLSQMAHVIAVRSERQSLFRLGMLSNRPLLGAVALSILLQLALVYTPFAQRIFQTVALPLADLGLTVAVSSIIFWAVETEKWYARRREPR